MYNSQVELVFKLQWNEIKAAFTAVLFNHRCSKLFTKAYDNFHYIVQSSCTSPHWYWPSLTARFTCSHTREKQNKSWSAVTHKQTHSGGTGRAASNSSTYMKSKFEILVCIVTHAAINYHLFVVFQVWSSDTTDIETTHAYTHRAHIEYKSFRNYFQYFKSLRKLYLPSKYHAVLHEGSL